MAFPDRIVEGKVVVVTGGGGGIGRAIAHLMAEQGAKVVVNDLGTAVDGSGSNPSLAEQVAQEIRAAGGAAVANADSVATWEGAERIIETALDAFGRVDCIVNNAAVLQGRHLSQNDPRGLGAVHRSGPQWQLLCQPRCRAAFSLPAVGCFRPYLLDLGLGRSHGAGQLRRGQDGPRRPIQKHRRGHATLQRAVQRRGTDRIHQDDGEHCDGVRPNSRSGPASASTFRSRRTRLWWSFWRVMPRAKSPGRFFILGRMN